MPPADQPAFSLHAASASAVPVLVAVPHGGRAYPPAVLARMRQPEIAALRLEDRLVDRLGEAVAAASGAALLVAHAPRALIDLNRGPEDIDWTMFTPNPDRRGEGSARARGGLGLVPRRLPGLGEIWRQPATRAELEARLATIHEPYHQALSHTLEHLRARWGAAVLLDLHSMPPLPPRLDGPAAQLVLGDRFGASCHGALVAGAFAQLSRGGWRLAHNRPYAGGYVLERHGNPRGGIHAMQLEIDRACYLDSRLVETGPGFAAMVAALVGLVRRLGEDVAGLGRRALGDGWAEAAE